MGLQRMRPGTHIVRGLVNGSVRTAAPYACGWIASVWDTLLQVSMEDDPDRRRSAKERRQERDHGKRAKRSALVRRRLFSPF